VNYVTFICRVGSVARQTVTRSTLFRYCNVETFKQGEPSQTFIHSLLPYISELLLWAWATASLGAICHKSCLDMFLEGVSIACYAELCIGDIRFMRICAEVPRGWGVKRQWGCRQRQFSALSRDISSETLEMMPVLLYSDTQSIVCFSLIPKCMTLNDLEWLFRVQFCFRAGLAFSDSATFEK